MTSSELNSFIKFLQDYGVPVINGRVKLTVTSPILREINKVIQSIKEDVYVSKLSNCELINKYSNNNELMFMYDFIKKAPLLKIGNTQPSHNYSLYVGDFSNLKYLELYKVCVKELKGLQFLRETLEAVICSRCLEKLSDLLLNCDSQDYVSCIWSKLRYALLLRNELKVLDDSFIHTPWLQYLDLSYNHLEDIQALACLRYLTHLNVGFNHLISVPRFAMFKLKVLLLNNNYITDISGISSLENLEECDLNDNCIVDHASLISVAELPSLKSLSLLRNPLSFHSIHRSMACGYLHENIANNPFLLDGKPLTSAEREYIRYCPYQNPRVYKERRETDSGGNKETRKTDRPSRKGRNKIRNPVIADLSRTSLEISGSNSDLNCTLTEEDVDSDHLEWRKQIEAVRIEHGPEHWLHSKAAAKVEDLIGIKNSVYRSLESRSDFGTGFSGIAEFSSTPQAVGEHFVDLSENVFKDDEETGASTTLISDSSHGNDEHKTNSSDEEKSEYEEEEPLDFPEEDLWLVERLCNLKRSPLFLILTDEELVELEPAKRKVISRWNVDSIERYIKISNEPFQLQVFFQTPKRDNRQRKYILEYADAQVLMAKIDKEVESRTFDDQILLRCIKCDFLFCREKPKREIKERGFMTLNEDLSKGVRTEARGPQNTPYVCPTCHSTAVLEEDRSVIQKKKNTSVQTLNIENELKLGDVTQSSSLSSIGSAASLEQNSDRMNNEEACVTYQESDIEIISNPSESSIEILAREPSRSSEQNKTVLQRLSERLSISEISTNDLPSVTAALNQVLTESSSSGSMTDSSCTTIESNYPITRGPHRISQSTVDEVLKEESSAETSPQQRCSEEKSFSEAETFTKENNIINKNNCTVLEYFGVKNALHAVLPSTSPRKVDLQASSTPLEYSYSDFSYIDHRIKLFLWDEIIPSNVEITAFIKVQAICRPNQSSLPFPGFLVFTNAKMYLIKMTKEEAADNFGTWLQKCDNVSLDKIKLIQPVLWKQGFCIHIEELVVNNSYFKYIMLLYDEKRTDNFLSFVKDLGSVHVEKSEEFAEERSSFNLIQTDEIISNLTMTDNITVHIDNGVDTMYNFVALVVTNSKFIILKGDAEWLIFNSSVNPIIIREETLSNLINVEVKKSTIELKFIDEAEDSEEFWNVKTVSSDAVKRILNAIREPWEELFGVKFSFSQGTN